ncbi:MAG: S-adenosylmethionine decarboxylase [Crocinitomicaceae bacterium]|nr:S-adenosylmethionine decarboxylase [Crocinitomicaceae bacterium]
MKAELFNLRCWVNNSDQLFLKTNLGRLLEESEFTVLSFIDHHFNPQGYTCLWLLSESHLAVHTYPEHSKSYVELTSCIEFKKDNFHRALTELFEVSELD